MASQSHSLLRLFTSGPETAKMGFDASLPSPPDSNTSYSSPAMLSRANSECATAAFQSKLNPESAIWTPSSWGDFSTPTTKVGMNLIQSCLITSS